MEYEDTDIVKPLDRLFEDILRNLKVEVMKFPTRS